MEDKKNKKIIFILGHGRSGTTLLNCVLSAHPAIHFINYEFNDLGLFYENARNYEKYGSEKYTKMAQDFFNHPWIKENNETAGANSFRELIDNIFDLYRKKNHKEIIGVKISDKIKENVAMIKEVFPDADIIHIIRDPRDILVSLKNVYFGMESPYYLGKSWKEAIENIQSLEHLSYRQLKYEELISNPRKELENLCLSLKIPFSKEMLEFYRNAKVSQQPHLLLDKPFVSDNCNKWKKNLSAKEIKLIYAEAGKKMYELGYGDADYSYKISFVKRVSEYLTGKIRLTYKKWLAIRT